MRNGKAEEPFPRRMRTILVALAALSLVVVAPAVAVGHHDEPPPRCMEVVPPDCEPDDLIGTCELRVPPRCSHR